MADEKSSTQNERILDASIKGLSLRNIAAQEGLTVHAVRTTLKQPAILKEIAEHRTKYAVVSYENACALTDIIAGTIPALRKRDLSGDSKFLRDIAWIAKAQFEQSNSLLTGLIKEAAGAGDNELDEAAKLLAARVLRREADSVPSTPTVDAESYRDVESELPPFTDSPAA